MYPYALENHWELIYVMISQIFIKEPIMELEVKILDINIERIRRIMKVLVLFL